MRKAVQKFFLDGLLLVDIYFVGCESRNSLLCQYPRQFFGITRIHLYALIQSLKEPIYAGKNSEFQFWRR